MYWFAKIIVGRLGAVSSVVLSLLVTAVRFVAYYFTTYLYEILDVILKLVTIRLTIVRIEISGLHLWTKFSMA